MNEREIFVAALKKDAPDERSAFLDEACGGNAGLRQEVDTLLREHEQLGNFLESPRPGLGATIDVPLPRERPGTVIGPYKLLQQIGEGGMGTVYMAEQTQPVQRKVALKVIKPGMDSRQVIARFEAERQALAMMDHVNIARVLDAGATEAGRPYFVMELVHGVPITKYCDDNHLTPRERLELFVPVCQAIQHAHQKGIIHRDIKPSNVMITLYDGKPVPKVIDFGVAKATEQKLTERTLFTQYGTMVGTLEYMSPEQAEMSALGVDTRSDIYSLGVLLYELLTGSTPLTHKRLKEAAYAEVLRLIKEEEPPRPSTRLSDSGEALASISAQRKTEPAKLSKLMRGELDWIVMKTLEKDRNRRYETASGFAADVQRYLNDEPVQACPPSPAYRFRKFARRNRRLLATAGVLALALVLGTVISTWQAIRATEAEGLAQTRLQAEIEAQNATRAQLHLTQNAEDKARNRLYRSLVAQAQASRLSRRIGQRFQTLAVLAEATKIARDMNLPEEDFLKLRNEAIACLALPDLQVAKEWEGWPSGSWSVDFAGTLERCARVDRQGVVSIRRVADDTEIYSLPGMGSGESWLNLSPDGQFLGLARGTQFQLWNLAGEKPVLLLEGPQDAYAFSPDSCQFARALPDGSLCLYDLPSGRQTKQLEAGPRAEGGLAFHPKGRQLAIGSATGVQIRDLETGSVVAELAQPAVAGWRPVWHPDGKTLAVDGGDRIIHIWDVATRKPITRLEGHKNVGIRFAFNHIGDLLASTSWDGDVRLWEPRTGQQLFHTQAAVHYLRFSEDDHYLAAGVDLEQNKLKLWEIASTRCYRTLVRDPVLGRGSYYTSAVHPGGRLLAVGMRDGTDFWDLASGNHLRSIKLALNTYHLLFEPSGALLTNGPDGLRRWPVQAARGSAELLRVGPPQKLVVPGTERGIARSLDGRVLASAQHAGGLVLHVDRPDQPVPLGPHDDVRGIAVSPDGLVATGSHSGTKVKVWQAQDGKLEKELPVETGSWVGFSPNGKWLMTNGGGCRLWAVDGWQHGPQVGGIDFAFSPDSKLLAVTTGSGVVRLVDPDTGREYARLEDPNQDRAGGMSFTPDGTQLVTTNNDSGAVHVWDLRAIREQLVKMDLDWDLPAYSPAKETAAAVPLRVEVNLGEIGAVEFRKQALGYVASKQWDRAIAAYVKAVELNPKDAWTLNNLSWLLATCPDANLRDPGQALELAQRGLKLAPQDGNAWNTLGVAHYRAEDWKAAVVTLTKSNELLGGKELSFNAFFVAMSHWRMGNQEEAQKWHAQAVQWMEKNKAQNDELLRFRAEAEELLKIEKKAMPK